MNEDNKHPIFNVEPGGENFRLENVEYIDNGTGRPLVKTRAKGTTVVGAKIFSSQIVEAAKKHPLKAAISGILGTVIAGLILLAIEYSFLKSETENLVQLTNSPLRNSPIIVDSPDAKVIYEGSTQIPMDRRIWVPLSNFKRYDGQPVKAIFNILYNLPNGKQAYIEEFPQDGVALFYFNDDCSEISVAEKYRRTEIQMEDVCWIDEATCNGLNIEKPITPGPKAIKDIASCIQ